MHTLHQTDITSLEKYYRINLINSLAAYKPLMLLGTISAAGKPNLALVSSAFHLGANPPLMGLVLRPPRPENDSLRNIEAVGEFTLNNVPEAYYQQAHQASATYPSGVSEFTECGFQELYAPGLRAPFVQESTVRIGLKLRELHPMTLNQTTIVIGEIVTLLIDDQVVQPDGFIDPVRAGSVTVAGLDSYYVPQPLQRLAYAKPGKAPEALPASQ